MKLKKALLSGARISYGRRWIVAEEVIVDVETYVLYEAKYNAKKSKILRSYIELDDALTDLFKG